MRLLGQVEAVVVALPLALRGALGEAVAVVQARIRGSVTSSRLAKYWWKFSSPVSTVPQGVTPPAQLFSIPLTRRPVGSSLVLSRSSPAAGPVRRIGVVAVMRRL